MTDTTEDQAPLENEWTVLFNPLHIKDKGSHQKLEANDDERKNLTRRFDLLELNHVTAHLVIENTKRAHSVKVSGDIIATVTQACVISDEPVTTDIKGDFEAWFADPDSIVSLQKARREKAIENGNELPIMEEEEDPEPMQNGLIDLGELVAQNLSLLIPAYPKKEGREFDGHTTKSSQNHEKAFENPFKALADWKKDN